MNLNNTRSLLLSFFILIPYAKATLVHYVVKDNPAAESPYISWKTAAATIQDAVDVAVAGSTVLVSNGIYNTGGKPAAGQVVTNRVTITNAINIRSVNGPAVTMIMGNAGSILYYMPESVRGVYMASNTTLAGFTITNGFTSYGTLPNKCGGGIYGEGQSCVVSNCVLTGNQALLYGGGAYNCTLIDCTLTGNEASNENSGYGGGAYISTLHNCKLINNRAYGGGGAAGDNDTLCSYLYNCSISGNSCPGGDGGGTMICKSYNCTYVSNSATYWGGGACFGELYNCFLTKNSTYASGGGARGCYLYNCTITHNTTYSFEVVGHDGGGTFECASVNCIIYYNIATNYPNVDPGSSNPIFPYQTNIYCCTWPYIPGPGNITNQPLFAETNSYHISEGSPCIDTGTNLTWMLASTDLDGHPRIFNNSVDMGADEAAIICRSISVGQTTTSTWDTVVNAKVRLESSTNLMTTNWAITGNVITSDQQIIVLSDPSSANIKKFYRLKWAK